MTRDEVAAQIVVATKNCLTLTDLEGMLNLPPNELEATLKLYADSAKEDGASFWTRVFTIVKDCAEVASVLLPIFGAAQGIYGLAQIL